MKVKDNLTFEESRQKVFNSFENLNSETKKLVNIFLEEKKLSVSI